MFLDYLYLNDSYNNPSVESVQMLHVISEGLSEGNLFYLWNTLK